MSGTSIIAKNFMPLSHNPAVSYVDDTPVLNFVRAQGSKFEKVFLVDGEIEDPNTAMNGPSSAIQ